ncbi:MAG TPA: hypothetical protein VK509_06755 [Polyangiales bacterium]|nr:hypothetical protein [Polyangiales bacterium]
MPLLPVVLDQLTITDEASFAHVALYRKLKRVLQDAKYSFRVAEPGATLSWDRALFLNLTFWSAEQGADVLCEHSIPADVVAHVAWHQLASAQLARFAPAGPPGPNAPCADALLFGEAIASAFDLYLVGRLLNNVPDSEFIATQVSIMGDAAEQAGMSKEAFAALLEAVAGDPERAFEDLRALLFDVSRALLGCRNASEAQAVLEGFAAHRFESLLHHYELSNWVLYARAFGAAAPAQAQAVHDLDATLRAAPVALDWLTTNWL